MDGSIVLGRANASGCWTSTGKDPSPCVRLRAHIVLLLSEGHAWSLICAALFCSTATIARWKRRFEAGGVDALLAERRGRRPALLVAWAVTGREVGADAHAPRLRLLPQPLVLRDAGRGAAGHPPGEGQRRDGPADAPPREPGVASAAAGAGPGRPAAGRRSCGSIRELLRDLPEDEAAVFQDEVDLNLNPEIGCMWMPRGKQAEVVTPGTNVKRYLAGSSAGGPGSWS